MEAVDSHVHLTNPQKVRYAWMEGLGEQWNKPWTEGDLQAQISACPYNIDSVVFVEVGLVDTKSAIAEAEWVLSTPWNLVKAYVAMIPVHEGKEGVTRFLYAFRGHDGQLPKILKGGRVVMPPFASDVCTNPKYIEGVQTLGTLGLSYDICCRPDQLPAVVELVQQCPGVSFILDHLGLNGGTDLCYQSWREHIDLLAQLPNVVAKLGGTEEWKVSIPQDYLHYALKAFGADRCLAESNWFLSEVLDFSLPKPFDLIEEACLAVNLPVEKIQAVMRDNARRVYRL
eukprot:GEMP01057391.1.p1 GENE.GEMP01057391.1~~GEMP01057391.1.p1  ORF type:complete len:301 (+),score=64.60 GEMP01057391.1:49-903(+)